MQRAILLLGILLNLSFLDLRAQNHDPGLMRILVLSDENKPVSLATIEIRRVSDSALVERSFTDSLGLAVFKSLFSGSFHCRISRVGFVPETRLIEWPQQGEAIHVVLTRENATLEDVRIQVRKPPVRFLADKVVVNVEASITNAGATVMDVLEKSPGIAVDRNGNISLKGKSGVLILIDGKPVYLSGEDLTNMLTGMNASQIETIEIMDNPPARFDAAGNAGAINIRTRKTNQQGFNGNLTLSYGQGYYGKTNNSLLLNHHRRKTNFYFNYNLNSNPNFLEMTARRAYYATDEVSKIAELDQPFRGRGWGTNHNFKFGIDQEIAKDTRLGISYTGTAMTRDGDGRSSARWLDENGTADSLVHTLGQNFLDWKQDGLNLSFEKRFKSGSTLLLDADHIQYRIDNRQYFENVLTGPGGYREEIEGLLPSTIRINTAKIDYEKPLNATLKWEAGAKTANVRTDNEAVYRFNDGSGWVNDLGRSNHFLYEESIHAAYSTLKKEWKRVSFQGGLRYEYTNYSGNQLGNAMRQDSSFTRKYNSLFPTLFTQWKVDSVSSLSFSAGRRIDRPAYQKLNPFVYVINKYTNQQGNPYFLPQYTWNFDLGYLYKNNFTVNLSYNYLRDYISQIFFSDTATGQITYSEGNIGKMQNLSLTFGWQTNPFPWWDLSSQLVVSHKTIEGVVWKPLRATMDQFSLNLNNQFRLNKDWSAELMIFYISRSQNDIQEVLEPTGQLSVGVARQLFDNRATLKFNARDLLYTVRMAGLTQFLQATEEFSIQRDSRMINLSLSWRFGKSQKTNRRRSGSAADEINRVGG